MFSNLKQNLLVWLIKKVQKYGSHRVRVLDRTYEVSESVFNPTYYFTSIFMAKHIKASPDDVVLDMGTGSGIQAITAAQTASRVLAIDINPDAVRYAKRNARLNGVGDAVSVIEGDLFSPLAPDRTFSLILFTPPYLEGPGKTVFDNALYDSGKALIRRFFKDAKNYLKPDGYVQMLYSSIAGHDEAIFISEEYGWHHTVLAREKTLTEEFIIYTLTLN